MNISEYKKNKIIEYLLNGVTKREISDRLNIKIFTIIKIEKNL